MTRIRLGDTTPVPGLTDASLNPDWPVLTSYDGRNLDRIALPMGGIGTGTVSLGGRGDLRDWEIANRAAKGFNPDQTFFAIRAQAPGEKPIARCLEGQLLTPFEGAHGAPQPHAGLPRFANATFHAAYPLAQIVLTDPDLPLHVRLEAFNPLVPTDPDRSGLPVAILRYVVRNTSSTDLDVAIGGNIQNFIGRDTRVNEITRNVNQSRSNKALQGVLLGSDELDPAAERWGTIALASLDRDTVVTTRESWADFTWGDALLDFWDDFLDDGKIEPRGQGEVKQPIASVSSAATVPAGEERIFQFVIAWHFPNRQSWDFRDANIIPIGNYYAAQFADAWSAANHAATHLESLEADTVQFVGSFVHTDIPAVFKEAALSNISTLRSQTCFRTPDGNFFGWEGCNDTSGSCHGNCTHVWNYEQATAFLFGSLSRSFRDLEFEYATNDEGVMAFRNEFPLGTIARPIAAADGQMGSIMKLHRDWKLCGDDAWLTARWPRARKALEFAWAEGSWDANQDGVMEGCQHNTMDVEYFGPNPEIGFWYLGALKASAEMARHLGDTDFADKCDTLQQQGAAWFDANLFNGEFYEHEIRPIPNAEDIHPALRLGSGARNLVDPELQVGPGCLADGLVGQLMADVSGLGSLADATHVRTMLGSIVEHNYRESMRGHFNHLRTYALSDESGTLNCTWPRGGRPKRPMPYSNEVWTGIEYTVAAHLVYQGDVDGALKVTNAVRDRFDGERRNPFNEAECGHHYARAMASWALALAATGFRYDAVDARLSFSRPESVSPVFWSSGNAAGTIVISGTDDNVGVQLSVHNGSIDIQHLYVGNVSTSLENRKKLSSGDVVEVTLTAS